MANIESILSQWAQAPSESEERKCEAAVQRIGDAIRGYRPFSGKDIKIFRQGSYENRTNVKKDSDVDVVICLYDSFFHDGLSGEDEKGLGLSNSQYTYGNFKTDVLQCLVNEFGSDIVERKNKCIAIKGNEYRVNADAIPCLEHRRYSSRDKYISGIEFWNEQNDRIINWPKQHYDNGVSKNSATRRTFKSIVRVLKNAKNDMVDKNIITDDSMPSFLLECLAWNVPNSAFNNTTWTSVTRSILAAIFNATLKKDDCWDYAEVSDLKYLFRGRNKWTYQTSNVFTGKVWEYLGYE